jgi:hypothetical protein
MPVTVAAVFVCCSPTRSVAITCPGQVAIVGSGTVFSIHFPCKIISLKNRRKACPLKTKITITNFVFKLKNTVNLMHREIK